MTKSTIMADSNLFSVLVLKSFLETSVASCVLFYFQVINYAGIWMVLNKLLIPSETIRSFLTRKFVESNIILKNSTFLLRYRVCPYLSLNRATRRRKNGRRKAQMKEKLVSFLPFASRGPRAWFERDSREERARAWTAPAIIALAHASLNVLHALLSRKQRKKKSWELNDDSASYIVLVSSRALRIQSGEMSTSPYHIASLLDKVRSIWNVGGLIAVSWDQFAYI